MCIISMKSPFFCSNKIIRDNLSPRVWEALKPDIVAQVDTVGIPQFWLLNKSLSYSESQQAAADSVQMVVHACWQLKQHGI